MENEEIMDLGTVDVTPEPQPLMSPFEGAPSPVPPAGMSNKDLWLKDIQYENHKFSSAQEEYDMGETVAQEAMASGIQVSKTPYGYHDMTNNQPLFMYKRPENLGFLERGLVNTWGYWGYGMADLYQGHQPDPDFKLDDEKLKMFMEGDGDQDTKLPEHYRELAAGAVSLEHLRELRRRYALKAELNNELDREGTPGLVRDIILSAIDPAMFATVLAAEIPGAQAIGALGLKYKLSSTALRLAEGAYVGGVAAGQTAVQSAMDPDVTGADIAIAGALGLTFGTALAISPGLAAERRAIEEMASRDIQGVLQNSSKEVHGTSQQSNSSAGATVAEGRDKMYNISDNNPALWMESEEALPRAGRSGVLDSLSFDTATSAKSPKSAENVTQDILVDHLLGSTKGTTKGNAQPSIGLAHDADRLRQSFKYQVDSALEGNFEQYQVSRGRKYLDIQRSTVSVQAERNEFNRMVAEVHKGTATTTDPHVLNAVSEGRRILNELGDRMVEVGILKSKLDDYFPLVSDLNHWKQNVEGRLGTITDTSSGAYKEVRKIVSAAWENIKDPKLRDRLSDWYIKRLVRGMAGLDANDFHNVMSSGDATMIRQLMEEFGADADLVDAVTSNLEALKKSDGAATGDNPRAKARTQGLDYNLKTFVTDKDGNIIQMSIKDLFSNSYHEVMTRYIQSSAGRIAIASAPLQRGDVILPPIKSRADFEKYKQWIREEEFAKGRDPNKLDLSKLDNLFNEMYGGALWEPKWLKPGSLGYDIVRMIASTNFVRFMSNMGFNNLIELPTMIGMMGLKAIYQKGMPAFRLATKYAAKGSKQYRDDMVNQMAILGVMDEHSKLYAKYGLDRIVEDVEAGGRRLGEEGMSNVQRGVRRIEEYLDVGKDMTNRISLNQWILSRQVAATSSLIMQRMSNMARKFGSAASMPQDFRKAGVGSKVKAFFTGKDLKRLNSLGLDDTMIDRIFEHFLDPSKVAVHPRTGEVLAMHFDKWDPVVRDALLTSAMKWSKYMVQRRDYAGMTQWMSDPVAKIVFQFQSFTIDAWHKQLMYGLNHFDVRQFVTWSMQVAAGAGTYYAIKWPIYAAMGDGADKDEFYEKHLSPEALAKKGVARASFASFLPQVVDAGAMFTGNEAVFAARSSGLGQSLPGLSLAIDPLASVADTGQLAYKALFSDEELTQKDIKKGTRVLPWGNHAGFSVLMQLIMDDRPVK